MSFSSGWVFSLAWSRDNLWCLQKLIIVKVVSSYAVSLFELVISVKTMFLVIYVVTVLLIDWLIIYCFTPSSRIFHLYGDVTITGEGLQNLGLCSALRAFEQGGIFIVPHLLWHGDSVFLVSSEGPPHSIAFYNTQGDVEDLFWPGSSRVPYQSPFTTHKGMWRTYSNTDPHGVPRNGAKSMEW